MNRFFIPLLTMFALSPAARSQVVLLSGTYSQNFDSAGGGLPDGWFVYTGANTSSLGTPAVFSTAATAWGSTTGQFANMASAQGLAGTETSTQQAGASNRSPGIRQTGSFGDPGASFDFNFSSLGLRITSLSLDAMMLSVQPRSTGWTIQYGIGASPTVWTTFAGGTYSDPGIFGTTTLALSGFGTDLDNQASAWIRVAALGASTGSGNRDTFGVDNFSLTASTIPEPSACLFMTAAIALLRLARHPPGRAAQAPKNARQTGSRIRAFARESSYGAKQAR